MLKISLIVILLAGLYGYYSRLCEFNQSMNIQRIAKDNFNLLSDGMSLSEVQEKLNKKGTRVNLFNNSFYRWSFGDSIVAKKGKEIISVSEFINNSSYKEGYRLVRTPAFIDVLFVDNKLVKKECLGLD